MKKKTKASMMHKMPNGMMMKDKDMGKSMRPKVSKTTIKKMGLK